MAITAVFTRAPFVTGPDGLGPIRRRHGTFSRLVSKTGEAGPKAPGEDHARGSRRHLDGGSLVDVLDQAAEDVRIGGRENPVAEVEDMAGPAGDAAEDGVRAVGHALPGAEQERRVEVALHGAVEAG